MKELTFFPPDVDCTNPPQGWSLRHDQLKTEFIIAASSKPYLSKLTQEEWKHAIMDMVVATGRDNDNLDRLLTRVLNRVACVERNLIAMADGKRAMPTAEELRALAKRLSPQIVPPNPAAQAEG